MNKLELHEVLDAIALLEAVAGDLLGTEINSMKNKIKNIFNEGK